MRAQITEIIQVDAQEMQILAQNSLLNAFQEEEPG